ncbi:unnamed protein product [Trifolium pratense]|uniref:Uncharacterized protein n=1 Tax=Trifolium pratense TaxID=57577 RepID=A0ACB0M5R3_TRIPR|nr:unnamed protein product [Trifolium pratense]
MFSLLSLLAKLQAETMKSPSPPLYSLRNRLRRQLWRNCHRRGRLWRNRHLTVGRSVRLDQAQYEKAQWEHLKEKRENNHEKHMISMIHHDLEKKEETWRRRKKLGEEGKVTAHYP